MGTGLKMYKYNFDKEGCWYKAACNKYNTEECYQGCLRYMEMHFLMETSGIPVNRQHPVLLTPDIKDVQAFVFLKGIKDDIVNFVNNGENLYIWGKGFGNGKTTWGIKLTTSYFDQIWCGNGFKTRALFVNVPIFLTKIREGISYQDPDFEAFKRLVGSVPLVVWDDIAATNIKDFDYGNLHAYLETRKLNGLSNIFTGNLDFEELQEKVGQRLASRIWNDSAVVEFSGRDRRIDA